MSLPHRQLRDGLAREPEVYWGALQAGALFEQGRGKLKTISFATPIYSL